MQPYHIPVLVNEITTALRCREGGIYVDGTVGGAGHAQAILEATAPGGILVGIDRDGNALREAKKRLADFSDRVSLIKGNFADIKDILLGLGINKVDGILLDLGVSSHQLDAPERGFSFSQEAPLDMRMDQDRGMGAHTMVNTYPEEKLADIIWEYGEERMARRIARAIVFRRRSASIETTTELASVIASAMPARMKRLKIHPATRTFQAIRIAVNDELENLKRGINSGVEMLNSGGRLAIISFHSLEDRIVKEAFALAAKSCICPVDLPVCVCGKQTQLKVIIRKPITAGEAEMAANPRSRSAKLRAAERT